jgi:1-acyl-sn-glycerol-3-phosphate acyltransferase
MHRVVNAIIKFILTILCSIHSQQVSRVPMKGPIILIGNHINFIEVPLVYITLQPRRVIGLAASTSWENPFFRFLFNLWGAIPIRRWDSDLAAMKKALTVLENGDLLAIAPEGTRSGDGRLQEGHPGVALLASKSGAPMQCVATYGGERFWKNLLRLRKTEITIVVGEPFQLRENIGRITGSDRKDVLDEIMCQLASILPEEYRGVYADFDCSSSTYLICTHPFTTTDA